MKTFALRIVLLGAAAALTACGNNSTTSTVDSGNARGTLVDNPPFRIASVDAATLGSELGASASGAQLLQVTGPPACGVDFHYMHYWTVNASPTGDIEANATAALMIPTGAAPACSGPRPILLYAHGTDTNKLDNIADITNPANTEGALIAAMFAAQGYIVVAPNYVGYDTSNGRFHPYLNADAQSKDMIDALTAARKALGKVIASSTTDNGKLFISGYSQGGYVAMATHKALQAAGQTVTASAPMSGPYALSAFGDAVFYGNVDLGSTIFTPLLTTSYQRSYGNIYASPGDVFEDAYAGSIDNLLPNGLAIDQLIANGKLPQLQLFHDTIWNTGSAQLDATLDVPANPLFALGFGPANLVKDTYRFAYIMDAIGNPDGAVPTQTNLIPAAAPQNTLRQAFKLNDLRSWVPTSPVFMCGGENDPVVFFSVNTQVMQAFWTYVAPPASPLLVSVLDVDSAITGPNDPFLLAKGGFAQAEAAIDAGAGGGAAGLQARTQTYHTTVAPFCSAAARGFFSQF
jgi:predicted dienelactone hydrolase